MKSIGFSFSSWQDGWSKLLFALKGRSKFWPTLIATILVSLCVFVIPAFTQQTVTLNLLMHALDAEQLSPLIQEFEAKNPQIRIHVIQGPAATNLVEDLYTSAFLLGDSPYDLVYMDIVWTPKFAAAGWLQELDDRISQTELSEFLRGDVEGGRYQGKLYRIPIRSDVGMLYYRTDLLSKINAQPPQTFRQLITLSQQLKQQGLVDLGYLWQGRQYEGTAAMFVEVLEGTGGFWVNPDTLEVGLDQPAAIEAVNFLVQTIQNNVSPRGVVTSGEEETRLLFQAGRAGFLRSWPYVYGLAAESPIAGKFAIVPMVHAPNQTSGACQGGWGFGIAKNTRHPQQAWQFIQYITSEESQRKLILATGYVPSRRSLFTDPKIISKYSHYSQLLPLVENAVLRPPIAQYAQASDILQRYLSAAFTGRMSPERAMQAAANETRRLLNS